MVSERELYVGKGYKAQRSLPFRIVWLRLFGYIATSPTQPT